MRPSAERTSALPLRYPAFGRLAPFRATRRDLALCLPGPQMVKPVLQPLNHSFIGNWNVEVCVFCLN
jgi:hypothetical protein